MVWDFLGGDRDRVKGQIPQWLSGKESISNAGDAGDTGLIPQLGRSPGGGQGNPLQYSCLGESHGQRGLAGWVAQSWT